MIEWKRKIVVHDAEQILATIACIQLLVIQERC